ncbi:A/G-specific adenine glycosylase [Alistipes sp.]|uniref:A/G-specific adenine glycosylase n=1 Tax=Alistipes sp. TaxID=1872444 RepID=UPI003AB66D2F
MNRISDDSSLFPIAPALVEWYALRGRDLLWRRTRDPYLIWLSEIILQQTRVRQGTAYFERLAARFPDVTSLASATEDEVLRLWQGLGYYCRARNLRAAAREVVARFGGRFPVRYDELRTLPGVGDYTAAAVASIAGGEPRAAVDGNALRVLARVFDLDLPVDTAAGRRAFAELAQQQLDAERPGVYNQAVMDFGATVCTPRQPACAECPLSGRCLALGAGTVGQRPVKGGRTKVRDRWFHYLHVCSNERTLLRRRGAGDIWQGLYEFPLIEQEGATDYVALCGDACFTEWFAGAGTVRLLGTSVLPPHQLSHQTIHAVFYRIEAERFSPELLRDFLPVAADSLGDYAVSRLTERYLLGLQKGW